MSFLLGLLMVVPFANAQSSVDCPDIVERYEGTQIQQQWSENSQSCFFSVSPRDAYVDLIYRDHLFTTQGLFLVFNSYGTGPDSETTGAREFFLFPRPLKKFDFYWNRNSQELEVTHVTGNKFIFDARKGRLKSVTNATVSVADDVNKNNRGGIEITNFKGLVLDGGFKMGGSPSSVSSGSSVIKDVQGKSCSVKNYEVFKYTSDGEVFVKYSDSTLPAYIKKRCPGLNFP